MAAGGTHTLALTDHGRMFVWGRGSFGRLGLGGGPKDHYLPVEVPLPGGSERWRVAAIAAGGRHSLALCMPVRDAMTVDGDGLLLAVRKEKATKKKQRYTHTDVLWTSVCV